MFGLLNIDKPAGITSRDVVDRVVRLIGRRKAGHAGTLDPLATGVLVVCVGAATRLIEYVQRMPKRYTATFLLGRRSDTDDVDGDVVELPDPPEPAREDIERALPHFVGEIDQRPPVFSALKIGGRRAYTLARQGKKVELPPRKVRVHDIRVVGYDYPALVLDVACGSGAYVRALGRDLARSVGTAAVMSALVRTAVGGFSVADACPLDELSVESIAGHLLPARLAVESLPSIHLTEAQLRRVANGMTIQRPSGMDAEEIVAMDARGELAAILVPRGGGELGPTKNFAATRLNPRG